jgi:DNA-binding CsgD family transcriptional regulator
MNPKRYTKAMPVKNTNDEMIEVGAMEFADSRIPLMEKKRGVDFVPFGDRNDYPTYLLWLYNKSAKHNAIINGKCVYIMGNGLMTESEPGKVFLKKANEKQSWDQLMKLACLDIENFGGVYLQVIPKLAGGFNVYHMSYDRIRANEDNTCFYYRKKWNNTWEQPEAEYPAFNPSNNKTSIFYFKEYRCGKNPYALPSWVAACNWVESDIEVSRHTLTNAKTGFSASKFINFYNGEPDEDKKRKITARFENAATGAEGKKVLIGFNNDPSKRPTIDDLGASDLTKEDFGAVDNLITNNIFSGHNITHPLLFGIQQEGKLGNASELKTAYEIFKNTYVTHKQKQIEEITAYFSGVAGVDAEYHLKDVEPVGMELDPVQFKELLPKEWILEKFGIDPAKYGIQTAVNNVMPEQMGNETLVKLSGRQQQNLMRIVRLFSQGKLTKGQASIQLSAYGFTNDQINQYLGLDENPITTDEQFNDDSDEFIADMFAEYGEDRANFSILKSEVYIGQDDDFQMSFAAVSEFTEREAKILELLKKQPDLSNVQIAEALKYDTNVVDDIVENLVKREIIKAEIVGGIPVRKILERLPAQTLPEIKVLYTYEKRDGVAGPELLKTSRPFCVKMVGLSKSRMFSRQDIQKLSERLGYSVFKRAGGYWNNNGTIEFQCRHGWMKHVVIKKK